MSETFPTNMPEATKRHILSFSKRFGQSHLYLAYHAAFPLALTPDLLYRLWANFQHDIHGKRLSIPWVAVADLLLSSLCEDVGHELYEMNVVLRNALLHNLKSNVNFGDQRIHELSDFLLAYVEQQLYTPNADTRDFAKSQRWTALAYTRPGAAAHELTSALLLSLEKDDKAEQIRIASLIETFAEPLAEFVPLLTYARGMKHYVYGDENKAKVELSKLVEQDLSLSVSEVNSPISEHLLDKTETSLKATFVPSPQVHQGSFRGSLSGFGTIEIIQVIEMSWKNGALLMKNSAERTGILYFHEGKLANCFEYNTETLILGDVLQQLGMATASQIEQAFSQQLRDAFGIRIGERLIMMGVINEKQLNEAVRTRALWIARELALWVEGSFEFISSLDGRSILPYDEESLEIEGMRVTMEMIKYADDWEQLRMYFPMGIHTTLAMNPAIPYTMRFGMQDLELMTAANRFHSIRHIANAVRRPEIDVAYDLVRLVQQRVLRSRQGIIFTNEGRCDRL